MNDGDSFDTDRLSGSLQYDDDQEPVDRYSRPPVADVEPVERDGKKSKKSDVSVYPD